VSATTLLQGLRDELVLRDYAAQRSYTQIVAAFRQQTGGRLDRITPAQLRRYHLFLLVGLARQMKAEGRTRGREDATPR
jgi:hypothetical protein